MPNQFLRERAYRVRSSASKADPPRAEHRRAHWTHRSELPTLEASCRGDQRRGAGASDNQSGLLRSLDPKQRRLLELFRDQGTATTAEMAAHLGLSPRTVTALCRDWLRNGFLNLHDPARKNRSYRLGDAFEAMVSE